MIAFACSACQKKLSCKDEQAGKKTKCPGCGQVILIPALASSPVSCVTSPTLAEKPIEQSKPTAQKDPNASQTQAPSSGADGTLGAGSANQSYDPSLTSFLSPPLMDDELGRLGKYRILKILGHGGMGVVFQAEDPRLKRKVAIKAILPGKSNSNIAGRRFLREAQTMAAVKHDHVATIFQVDEEAGVPFLAMEFLTGENLDQRIKRDKILPLAETLRIAREIAEGLEAAHGTGLIHRDIKPANIWLEAPRNRVKILDFGLARSGAQDSELTQQGDIVGTPAFMAPEQSRGETVDARTDLFSLGGILYRMTTGKPAFQGKDIMATLLSVAMDHPTPPSILQPEVPQDLSDLVMRLLDKNPDNRPASATVVVQALRAEEAKLTAPPKRHAAETMVADPAPRKKKPAPFSREPAASVRGPNRKGWLAALVVGSLVVLPLGWWLAATLLKVETANGTLIVEIDDPETEARIKNGKLILTGPDDKVRYTLSATERDKKIDAGPYKIRVEGADGLVLDTPEFTLKKGDKVVVRVRAQPAAVVAKAETPVGDPDRRAAEYVLSIGGFVKVDEQDREIMAVTDLPRELFRLTGVGLSGNKQLNDAGLVCFKGCKNLTFLDLYDAQVSDAGLINFKDCKDLKYIMLMGKQISDIGLVYFKDCKNLEALSLLFTSVSDAGVGHFKHCKSLVNITFGGTPIGDVGIANFKDHKKLVKLLVGNTHVSDMGLAHFKDCKDLVILHVDNTSVSNAGLVNFKDCAKLEEIALHDTRVSDAGLIYIKDFKNLLNIDLKNTKVTAAGIESLHKALPKCKIEWDGGIIEPSARVDPDRTAAEYVLSIGGECNVIVNEQERIIAAVADLPRESFRLNSVNLNENDQVTDEGLAIFKDCVRLKGLFLSKTKVTDAGLAHFKDCKDLEYLELLVAKEVTDAGMVYFKDCKNLKWLYLQATQVTDAGMVNFKDCKNLHFIGLGVTKVGDAGLAHFKGCKDVTQLTLSATNVGDAGLEIFKDCVNLTEIHLHNTKVTDAGLAHLKECKNLTFLILDTTQVGDAGLIHLQNLKKLTNINLSQTKVTAAGIEAFRKALPKCKILWDGGVIEP